MHRDYYGRPRPATTILDDQSPLTAGRIVLTSPRRGVSARAIVPHDATTTTTTSAAAANEEKMGLILDGVHESLDALQRRHAVEMDALHERDVVLSDVVMKLAARNRELEAQLDRAAAADTAAVGGGKFAAAEHSTAVDGLQARIEALHCTMKIEREARLVELEQMDATEHSRVEAAVASALHDMHGRLAEVKDDELSLLSQVRSADAHIRTLCETVEKLSASKAETVAASASEKQQSAALEARLMAAETSASAAAVEAQAAHASALEAMRHELAEERAAVRVESSARALAAAEEAAAEEMQKEQLTRVRGMRQRAEEDVLLRLRSALSASADALAEATRENVALRSDNTELTTLRRTAYDIVAKRDRRVQHRLRQLLHRTAATGWNAMVAYAASRKVRRLAKEQQNRVKRRVVVRLTHRILGMGWSTLTSFVARRTRQRAVVTRVLKRLRARAAATAFDGWCSAVRARRAARDSARRVVQRMRHATISAAFDGWCSNAAWSRARKQNAAQLVEKGVRRWMRRGYTMGWSALRARVVEANRERVVLTRSLQRMRNRTLAQGWSAMTCFVSMNQRKREMAARRTIGLNGLLARCFKRWSTAADAGAAERERTDTMFRRAVSRSCPGLFFPRVFLSLLSPHNVVGRGNAVEVCARRDCTSQFP